MNSWYDLTIELVHTMNSYPTKNPDALAAAHCTECESSAASESPRPQATGSRRNEETFPLLFIHTIICI